MQGPDVYRQLGALQTIKSVHQQQQPPYLFWDERRPSFLILTRERFRVEPGLVKLNSSERQEEIHPIFLFTYFYLLEK